MRRGAPISAKAMGVACLAALASASATASASADDGAAPPAAEAPPATPSPPAAAPATAAPATAAPASPDAPATAAPASPDAPPPDGAPPAGAGAEAPALRFGGDVAVLSLPRLVSVDLLVRYKAFAGGVAFEYLPPGIVKFGDKTSLSWLQAAAQARYFVWKPIFVGALVGYQFARADSEKFGSEIDYVSQGLFVGLRAGVLFTLKSGLALGGDLGLTIPIAPSLSQSPEDVDDSNARKAARTFGEFVMPQVSLFRVGFFF